jgi:hypothetical protein
MPRKKTIRISQQECRTCSALNESPANPVPVLTLNEEASIAFAEFLLNPPGPNQKAMDAANRYKAEYMK